MFDLLYFEWTNILLSYLSYTLWNVPLLNMKLLSQKQKQWRSRFVFFVSGPPVIYVPRTYYSVSSGSSVTLEVNVTSSNDITDLFWEKRNISSYSYEPIDVQSESRLNGGNISCPSLTITNATMNDNTYFRVKATNREGTSTGSTIYINVTLSMFFLKTFSDFNCFL